MSLPLILAVIVLLVAINGFFVAAELSTVSAKRARLAQLADGGHWRAQQLLTIVEDPVRLTTFIAATQVGITLTSLFLGFYGQSSLVTWLEPWLDQLGGENQLLVRSLVALLVLLVLTIFQVILGELLPKTIGLQYPEKLALWAIAPMQWSMTLLRPLIVVVHSSAQFCLRLLGIRQTSEHASVHSPEEILMLVEESSAGGVLDHEERRLLVNTLQLRSVTVRKVMIPRNRMLAADIEQDPGELLGLLANSPYSRLPLYEGSVDQIIGVVHLKDLLHLYYGHHTSTKPSTSVDLRQMMHKVLFIPDSLLIEDVIPQMQRTRNNVAIVVDEYGGTAGLVAFEDLIEEIIGEFQDEFDSEHPALRLRADNWLGIQGDFQLDRLSDLLAIDLVSTTVDTVGGYVIDSLGKVPTVGDTIFVQDTPIRVEKMDQNRVVEVSVQLSPAQLEQVERIRHE